MLRIAIICVCLLTSGLRADLTWQADLSGFTNITFDSAGWLVQMYRDVNNDTDLSTLVFHTDGQPFSGTGGSDDLLLTTYTTTLIAQEFFPGFPVVEFSAIFDPYTDLFNTRVYTVILSTNSWANAVRDVTETFVLDGTPFFIGDGGMENYSPPNNNPGGHQWTAVIPEPGTLIMLGLGLWGVASWRRRQKRSS